MKEQRSGAWGLEGERISIGHGGGGVGCRTVPVNQGMGKTARETGEGEREAIGLYVWTPRSIPTSVRALMNASSCVSAMVSKQTATSDMASPAYRTVDVRLAPVPVD